MLEYSSTPTRSAGSSCAPLNFHCIIRTYESGIDET
jgi:hypothetical protein